MNEQTNAAGEGRNCFGGGGGVRNAPTTRSQSSSSGSQLLHGHRSSHNMACVNASSNVYSVADPNEELYHQFLSELFEPSDDALNGEQFGQRRQQLSQSNIDFDAASSSLAQTLTTSQPFSNNNNNNVTTAFTNNINTNNNTISSTSSSNNNNNQPTINTVVNDNDDVNDDPDFVLFENYNLVSFSHSQLVEKVLFFIICNSRARLGYGRHVCRFGSKYA